MKIRGIVAKGKGKGKQLGYPTINLDISEKDIESGVYEGQVRELDANRERIVANENITSPSPSSSEEGGNIKETETWRAGIFVSRDKKTLEAHLIGFQGDLYGKEVEIKIEAKIRDVRDFGSEEELREQIREDIKQIKFKI